MLTTYWFLAIKIVIYISANKVYVMYVMLCKELKMRQYVLLNQLLITHDPRLLKTWMINWWQTWEANTRGARFSQFALCLQWFVQGDVLLTQYTLGSRGHVIMGFVTKTAFRCWNIEFYRRGNLFLRGKTRLVLRGEGAVKRPLVKKVKIPWQVMYCFRCKLIVNQFIISFGPEI